MGHKDSFFESKYIMVKKQWKQRITKRRWKVSDSTLFPKSEFQWLDIRIVMGRAYNFSAPPSK